MNAAARDAENISDSNSGYPIYAVSDIASLGSGRQVIPVEQPRVYYGEVIAQADPTTRSWAEPRVRAARV